MAPPPLQSSHPRQSLESLRFAILEHDYPFLHWDILLQEGDRLLGWRGDHHGHFLNGGPVVQTSDHRLLYLDYEGPVKGQRGSVRRIDGGTMTWRHLGQEKIEAEIKGRRWQGSLELTKINATEWFAQFSVEHAI